MVSSFNAYSHTIQRAEEADSLYRGTPTKLPFILLMFSIMKINEDQQLLI